MTCLQFNSKFVVTSSDDGTVKLWDVKTGEKYHNMFVFEQRIPAGKKFTLTLFAGDFIRDLVALESGGSGGVVWRIRSSPTKLVRILPLSLYIMPSWKHTFTGLISSKC